MAAGIGADDSRVNRRRYHPPAADRSCNSCRAGPVMAQNKTKQTRVTPASFIATIAGEQQRKDSEELIAMMRTITREPPKMWGASIVGFGTRQYVLASG